MARKPRSISYDVHPSIAMVQDWIATLKTRTGRSLAEWTRFIRAEGPKDQKACRAWLKKEFGIGTNVAWWLAERTLTPMGATFQDDPESYLDVAPAYVDQQYGPKKAHLRPICDTLLTLARGLGRDVKICPCKTMVPVYRAHVIATVTPTTMKRVDLGLCLTPLAKAKRKIPARLIDTGGFAKKDRITHRIPLADVGDVDTFVEEWLRRAYELDTPESSPRSVKLR
jgi:hypothetical protein